jgi:hypothetical protein
MSVTDRRDCVNPPASAPEGWQPPARSMDDEEPRTDPLTMAIIQRRARQVAQAVKGAQ